MRKMKFVILTVMTVLLISCSNKNINENNIKSNLIISSDSVILNENIINDGNGAIRNSSDSKSTITIIPTPDNSEQVKLFKLR